MNKFLVIFLLMIVCVLSAFGNFDQDFLDVACRGDINAVKSLLKRGANPNALDSKALRCAVENGHVEIVRLLLENGADANASDSLALVHAAEDGHVEIIKLLLENGADANALDSLALRRAAACGYVEIVKLLLENGADANARDSQAFINAVENGHVEIVKLLLERGVNISLMKAIIKLRDFDILKSINIPKQVLSNPDVVKETLLSSDYNFVKYFFENVPELKDSYLIGVGLSYTRGMVTEQVLKILSGKIKSHQNGYHVEISLEIAQDEAIMQYFSGFINPGGVDSYPFDDMPFTLADMNEHDRIYHEKVYQAVIMMAKKYDIPYLGICAGSQHLVLNSHGSLKRSGHSDSTEITFSAGTIPHFLLLTEEEKANALSKCEFENIKLIDAYTAHHYAGYIENLGKGVKLAAISNDGISESYSLGANKIGVQFHPEMYYYRDVFGLEINRYKQFLDNVFEIFEGYYRSMQYAKKMGISEEVAKMAIQKVNQELVERLEYCAAKATHETISSGLKVFDENNIQLWGKGLDVQYEGNMGIISTMPGLTAEDIAVTRGANNDFIIYVKDGQGHLIVIDRINALDLEHPLYLKFADGSSINLGSIIYDEAETSISGEDLVMVAS